MRVRSGSASLIGQVSCLLGHSHRRLITALYLLRLRPPAVNQHSPRFLCPCPPLSTTYVTVAVLSQRRRSQRKAKKAKRSEQRREKARRRTCMSRFQKIWGRRRHSPAPPTGSLSIDPSTWYAFQNLYSPYNNSF